MENTTGDDEDPWLCPYCGEELCSGHFCRQYVKRRDNEDADALLEPGLTQEDIDVYEDHKEL